jgi:pimeloyl-ACP methyl ester carboxylesterase
MGKLFFALPFLKVLARPSKKLLYFFARERDYYQAGGVMRETMRKVISENLAPELAKIKMSVLIVWGEKDRVIPPEEGRALAKKIKRAELKVVPGAGHKLPYEKPARFTRLVAEFFKDKQ